MHIKKIQIILVFIMQFNILMLHMFMCRYYLFFSVVNVIYIFICYNFNHKIYETF